jgi:hypothetical protein
MLKGNLKNSSFILISVKKIYEEFWDSISMGGIVPNKFSHLKKMKIYAIH